MKKLFSLLLLLSFSVSAQQGMENFQGFDKANMPEMMKNMQKMSSCMSKISPAELKRVENIAKKQDAAVKKLCAAGKRSSAEKKGIEIAKKMLKDPTVKKINKCQEFMADKIPTAPGIKSDDDMHICDLIVNHGQY